MPAALLPEGVSEAKRDDLARRLAGRHECASVRAGSVRQDDPGENGRWSDWLPAPEGPFWPVLRTKGPGKPDPGQDLECSTCQTSERAT